MKTRWMWTVVILAGTQGLIGCAQSVTVSDSDVQTVDLRQLMKLLGDQDRWVLIDVRPLKDFEEGHIPGAVSIPLPNLTPNDNRLAEAKQIVVYSGEPRDMLSRAAAKKLMAQGYRNVYGFPGGLDQWRRQHKRVIAGAE